MQLYNYYFPWVYDLWSVICESVTLKCPKKVFLAAICSYVTTTFRLWVSESVSLWVSLWVCESVSESVTFEMSQKRVFYHKQKKLRHFYHKHKKLRLTINLLNILGDSNVTRRTNKLTHEANKRGLADKRRMTIK